MIRDRKLPVRSIAWLIVLITSIAPATRGTPPNQTPLIGLSLIFQNSAMAPITLVGDAPRYIQEIDVVATTPPSSVDSGIAPLINNSEFSSLDWGGVQMVEEDWRTSDGVTFIRQRFYRGAGWMEKESQFKVFPVDASGRPLGEPLIASAGTDDRWKSEDDGFVRRFTVRQIATGCPAVGNCSGATFAVQGLAQLRDALNAEKRARQIPADAAGLRLQWNDDNHHNRTVAVSHAAPSAFPYGYGFAISLDRITNPSNGMFFLPGDLVSFRVTFSDGQGNRLHPLGSLPTYGEFVRGEITSGLRYYDGFRLFPTLYYALKHRESNAIATLSGPTNKLKTPTQTVGFGEFFLPQATIATVAADGYTAIAEGIPPFGVTFGGLFFPPVWESPVSDVVTFTIPTDAIAGTYVVAAKARREFGGEALNRATTTEIQIGTATASTFTPQTGPCNTCHTQASALGNVLHGLSDRRACYACHASLIVEPDTALDIRVHEVHDRSDRFPADVHNCAICHLTPPAGPARGLLN